MSGTRSVRLGCFASFTHESLIPPNTLASGSTGVIGSAASNSERLWVLDPPFSEACVHRSGVPATYRAVGPFAPLEHHS